MVVTKFELVLLVMKGVLVVDQQIVNAALEPGFLWLLKCEELV